MTRGMIINKPESQPKRPERPLVWLLYRRLVYLNIFFFCQHTPFFFVLRYRKSWQGVENLHGLNLARAAWLGWALVSSHGRAAFFQWLEQFASWFSGMSWARRRRLRLRLRSKDEIYREERLEV